MLSDYRSCVCISGCVKQSVKSYCVKVGAADPGPVVTVVRSFVWRPCTVNLLHSPRTKGHFHLWVLGGGCATMKGAGPSRPLWILSQPGRGDDTGNSFVSPARWEIISALVQMTDPWAVLSLCHVSHDINDAVFVLLHILKDISNSLKKSETRDVCWTWKNAQGVYLYSINNGQISSFSSPYSGVHLIYTQ